MEFLFDNDRPIYVQLVETLRIAIISGAVGPGERLSSVRELSMQAQVNPNTMQRALAQLEEEGLVFTERTNGKFVTRETALIEKVKNDLAKETTKAYLEQMKRIGFSAGEAGKCLKQYGGDN